MDLSESGLAVARAREEILSTLKRSASTAHRPQELIREIAGNSDRDAYRAAMMSLLASGVIERAESWKVKLSAKPDRS